MKTHREYSARRSFCFEEVLDDDAPIGCMRKSLLASERELIGSEYG